MVTQRLDRLSDRNLDELYLTLRNAIRNEYADKPVCRNHAISVMDAVRKEAIHRTLLRTSIKRG